MSSSLFVSSSISAKNSEEISLISKKFTKLYISEDISEKMVKINVESFSEEALRKLFNEQKNKMREESEERVKKDILHYKLPILIVPSE